MGFSERSWQSPTRGPVRAQVPTTAAAGTGAPRSQARPAADAQGPGGCAPGSCPGAAALRRPVRVRPPVAGRILPVDLEHERAALCARQRGHGAPAGRPLGSRGADGGDAGRRTALAARAERDASLICPWRLETSAFPPSAQK